MRGLTLSIPQWLDRIHHGDCLDVMSQMPDGSVDLVFTSPPYNLRSGTGNGKRNWNGYDGHPDNMPHAKYVRWQRECLAEMMRLIPDDGAIFYNHCHRVQNGLLQSHIEIVAGFPVRQAIVWHRSGGINHNPGYFLPDYEIVYFIAKPDFQLLDRSAGTVWRIHQDHVSWIPEIPTFPEELPARAIRASSAQVILDPFMGSGTTAVAAKVYGRHYIGIEQSERYCRIARERIEATIPGEQRPIPPFCYEEIPDRPPLGKSARIVYDYITARLENASTLSMKLTQPGIAIETGLSRQTVERAIKELKNGDWIHLEDHGRWCDYSLARNEGIGSPTPRNEGIDAPRNEGISHSQPCEISPE